MTSLCILVIQACKEESGDSEIGEIKDKGLEESVGPHTPNCQAYLLYEALFG